MKLKDLMMEERAGKLLAFLRAGSKKIPTALELEVQAGGKTYTNVSWTESGSKLIIKGK